jgi:hypothetical protein
MANIKVYDECLGPDRFMRLNYTGPDPWKMGLQIGKSLRTYFHVSSAGMNNTHVKWDDTGNSIDFYSEWWVKKEVSGRSNLRFHIKYQGSKDKKTHVGTGALLIWARVETSVSGWGPILKPFWAVYSYLIYDRFRRKAIESCQTRLLNFRDELKKSFNLGATDIPTAEGTYG